MGVPHGAGTAPTNLGKCPAEDYTPRPRVCQGPRFCQPRVRLGVLAEDPTYPLHPPVRKAIADAVRLLQAAGHETVPLSAKECHTAHALQVAVRFFTLDDTAMQIVDAAGEPLIPSVRYILERMGQVDWGFVDGIPESGLKRLSALNIKRKGIEDGWRRIGAKHRLDAVVGPSAQNTAVEHDEFGLSPYMLLLNLLDVSPWAGSETGVLANRLQYPACVIPFRRADASTAGEVFEVKPGQSAPQCESLFPPECHVEAC